MFRHFFNSRQVLSAHGEAALMLKLLKAAAHSAKRTAEAAAEKAEQRAAEKVASG